MSREVQLLKNTLVLGIGRLVAPAVSFILLPVYTHLITPGEYGTVDLIATYIGLFVPIILLRLDLGLFRYVVSVRNQRDGISKIVTNTLVAIAPLVFLSLIVTVVAGIYGWLPFAVGVTINLVGQILLSVFGQLARGLGRNKLFSIGAVVGSVTNLVLGIIFVVILKLGGSGMLMALGISSLANSFVLMLAIQPHRYVGRRYWNRTARRELIQYSLPLVLESSSWWVMNVSDRTIIVIVLGVAANGIYAVSNKIAALINLVTSVFWMSWSETASVHVDDKDRNEFYSKVLDVYIRGLGSACLLLVGAVPFLFPVIIGQNYTGAYPYIPVLIVAAFFSAIMGFMASVYTALKLSKPLMATALWSGFMNVVINIALIQHIGLYAAAIGTLVSYAFMAVYRCCDLRKYGVPITVERIPTVILLASGTVIVALFYLNNAEGNVVSILIAIVVAYQLNHDVAVRLLRKVSGRG